LRPAAADEILGNGMIKSMLHANGNSQGTAINWLGHTCRLKLQRQEWCSAHGVSENTDIRFKGYVCNLPGVKDIVSSLGDGATEARALSGQSLQREFTTSISHDKEVQIYKRLLSFDARRLAALRYARENGHQRSENHLTEAGCWYGPWVAQIHLTKAKTRPYMYTVPLYYAALQVYTPA
tara:strand:- start:411 stop:950 length:540 start_codon:yes stop_codon:yes gene_type:complete